MQNKTEKQGIWQKIKSIPYWTMNKYVNSQDNTENFQTMYSGAWFVAFIAMLVMSVICFTVDYNVLFGIEYTSSLNENYSFWSAVASATVIQFLIIICDGLFFKIVIFGKLRTVAEENNGFFDSVNKNHLFQFVVFGALFVYGFSWTIDLSNKTYFSAKANAIDNQISLKETYKEDATALLEERQNKIKELERTANKSIRSKEGHYNSLIASVVAKYEAIKAKYAADAKRYNYSKEKLDRYIAKYDAKSEAEKAALLIEKEKAIAPILASMHASIDAVRTTYDSYEKGLDYKAASARSELNTEIEANAKETQGRNVTYNFVNVILMIGLLLFAKDSINDTKEPTGSDDETQKDAHIPENTAHKAKRSTNSNTGHTTDTQQTKHSLKASKKTQKPTVITAKHSKTQSKVGDYIEFENLKKNTKDTVEYFDKDGYSFKRENGTVFIKHGKKGKYATLQNLNTWLRTYNNRVDQYTRELKNDKARANATKAALISQKINYMKENFVYAKSKPTSENKQERFVQSA